MITIRGPLKCDSIAELLQIGIRSPLQDLEQLSLICHISASAVLSDSLILADAASMTSQS